MEAVGWWLDGSGEKRERGTWSRGCEINSRQHARKAFFLRRRLCIILAGPFFP